VTTVEVFNVEEAGPDYVRLRNAARDVRINFADDETFSKEDSAGLFLQCIARYSNSIEKEPANLST